VGRLCADFGAELDSHDTERRALFRLGLRDRLYRKWLAVKQFLRLMSVAQKFLPP
jgi:hypothetical protein